MRNHAYAILYCPPEEHLYGAVWDDISFALPNEWNQEKPSNLFADTWSIPFNFFPACLQRRKVTLKALISEEVSRMYFHNNHPRKKIQCQPVPDYSSHGFAPSNWSPKFIWAPCPVMCTAVLIGWDLATPPHLGSYTRGAIGQLR
jgi:hypothetical protein